jgi:hypothetical protein
MMTDAAMVPCYPFRRAAAIIDSNSVPPHPPEDKAMSRRVVICLTALLLVAPTAAQPGKDVRELQQALADVLAGKRTLDDVRIDVHWAGNVKGAAATVHGNGVGIWQRNKQFRLTKEQVLGLLKVLDEGKFLAMPDRFGGMAKPGVRPGPPERLLGGVALRIGGLSKGALQLDGGKFSDELAKLASALLDVCTRAAQNGVEATSLADGLAKIAAKKLDPLTLSVLVHRIQGEGTGPDGWLFRVEGNVVTTRDKTAKGYGVPVRYEMSRKQLEELLKLLADNDAGNLPINLFATDYTDFTVNVLDKGKNLQARRFANMTPQTHGERQRQFDRIFAALERLHRQALKEGKPQPDQNQ